MCHHVRADLPAREPDREEEAEAEEEPGEGHEEPISIPPAPA